MLIGYKELDDRRRMHREHRNEQCDRSGHLIEFQTTAHINIHSREDYAKLRND